MGIDTFILGQNVVSMSVENSWLKKRIYAEENNYHFEE